MSPVNNTTRHQANAELTSMAINSTLGQRAQQAYRRGRSKGLSKGLIGCSSLLLTLSASGCVSLDLKQATYQALRQSDCRLNQLSEVCQGNYSIDYREYTRLRQDFMREKSSAEAI